MGVADRGRHDAGGHQPADVGDIGQQVGADRVGDARGSAFQSGDPGVGRVAGDDHLGLVLLGQFQDGVVVELLGLGVDGVVDDLVVFARAVDGASRARDARRGAGSCP